MMVEKNPYQQRIRTGKRSVNVWFTQEDHERLQSFARRQEQRFLLATGLKVKITVSSAVRSLVEVGMKKIEEDLPTNKEA